MKDVMLYKDYIGSVHYSAEDEVFYGKIEGIDDLVTFEGASVPELKKAFYEALDDYLEIALEHGKKPEKTFRGSLNIRLKAEVHKKANRLALIEGKTLNQFINEAVEHEINKKTVSLLQDNSTVNVPHNL